MLTKKDIIGINLEFDKGILINNSSLDYALKISKNTNSWIKQLAYLIRAILIDHVFKDGNKRTTAALVITYFDINNYNYSQEKINRLIIKIVKKNINNIEEIERIIENVIE